MENFKIKEKILEMILYGNPAILQFPKAERNVLGLAGKIRDSMYKMLALAVVIEKKYYKKTTVQDLDIEIDILRHFIRLAADKRLYQDRAPCLPFRKYEYWAKMLDEIGRMIGGYIKTLKQ